MSEGQGTQSWSRRARPITYRAFPISGCHVCTSHARNDHGYPEIRRAGRLVLVIRHLWEEIRGPIPEGLVVRHSCDNPACINLAHVILGTHADNVADRVRRNRSAKGERNGRAKLKPRQVQAILKSTESGAALARKYRVSPRLIKKIRSGEVWGEALKERAAPVLPF